VTLHNVCAILADAAFFEATDLARACMHYIVSSMETVLEGQLLDDLPPDILSELAAFCRERQGAKAPISRSGLLVSELMAKHATWAADLDVGKPTGGARRFRPIVPRSSGPSPSMISPGPSPSLHPSYTSPRIRPATSPSNSPALIASQGGDEPFSMDDDFSLDVATPSRSAPQRKSSLAVPPSPTALSFTPPRLQPWSKPSSESMRSTSFCQHALHETDFVPVCRPVGLRDIMESEAVRPSIQTRVPSGTPPAHGKPTSPAPSTSSPSWRSPLPSTSSTGWRPVDVAARPSLSSIQSEQSSTRIPASRAESSRPVAVRAPTATLPSPASSLTASSAAAPVFTPVRTSNRTASGSRPVPKSSFGAADVPWTNYTPVTPQVPPTDMFGSPSSPPSSSFASIQLAQRAEQTAIKETRAPRSFAEVMQQEAIDAQKRAEAEEFERWFEEESRKVQQAGQTRGESSSRGRGRGSGGAKSKSRGGKSASTEGSGPTKPSPGRGRRRGGTQEQALPPAVSSQ
jgi:hypothetical protein